MSTDFVIILRYLCEALAASRAADQAEPLVLEGVLIMLHGAPPGVTKSAEFHDIVWSVTTYIMEQFTVVCHIIVVIVDFQTTFEDVLVCDLVLMDNHHHHHIIWICHGAPHP